MKKICILGLSLFCFFAVNAQTPQAGPTPPATPVVPENPNAPEIKFEKLVHDYGTILKEANGECEFKFTNAGKEPLILSNARASCGCTVPSWPKEPILPGKSASIKVKYDTKRVGVINKQITVESNAKNNPVILNIKGEVKDTAQPTSPVKPTDGAAPVATPAAEPKK